MKNITFCEVTKANVKKAISIQHDIYPYENGQNDILETVGKLSQTYSYLKYYLIKQSNIIVGITGFYSYDLYPNDAWLGWFGLNVTKDYEAISDISMQFIKDKATERGYTTLRVFSDDIADTKSNETYERLHMKKEEYTNEQNKYYTVGKTWIYSMSLTNKPVTLWDNKCLFLESHEQRNVEIKDNSKHLDINLSKIELIDVDTNNVKQAIRIQQSIFPLESGKSDILESLLPTKIHYKHLQYWLVRYEEKYVGICGIYSYIDYSKDAWLGWFGLLPNYRHHGIGTLVLNTLIKKSKKLHFDALHVYTDSIANSYACKLYDKAFDTKEKYLNELNEYYMVGDTLIYSINLHNKPTILWDNKCINLKEHEIDNNLYPLYYERINKDNVKLAGLVQYEIFNNSNSCGYYDYVQEAKHPDDTNQIAIDYLVYYRKKPAGIIGLYSIDGYPDDIWLNWFGVKEKYRNHGFGTQMLLFALETAKQCGRKNFRLFTFSEWSTSAQHIYKRTMKLEENYNNKQDDKYCIKYGRPKIFSINLTNSPLTKWNSKYINLSAEKLLHIKSVEQMQKDGLFDLDKSNSK